MINCRSVTLDKCRKLTIVLGPIENTLQLNQCEDCLVISACRRAVLASCRRCTLHLAIQSHPILIQPPVPNTTIGIGITGGNTSGIIAGGNPPTPGTPTSSGVTLVGNEEILLAPFHTNYMRLMEHLNRVNLNPKVNYWDRPFLLGQDSSRQESSQQPSVGSRCWDLLQPAHFYPFNIPLLISSRGGETMDRNTVSGDAHPRVNHSAANCLDLSAALITDTARYFGDSDEKRLENYISMANSILPIPLPTAYLIALRERASIYQKWPQHIANSRLTAEQRHILVILSIKDLDNELTTGHLNTTQPSNPTNNSHDKTGAPSQPIDSVLLQSHPDHCTRIIRSSHTNNRTSNSVRNERLGNYSNSANHQYSDGHVDDHGYDDGQDSSRQESSQQPSVGSRCWDLLQPAHFYPFNIPLLISSRGGETMDRNTVSGDAHPRVNHSAANCLDLSAALITDTARYFGDSDEKRLENYISMANSILPIPLPTAYLIALRERASIYQKWPQHIAVSFCTLLIQLFRSSNF
ncbi:unnamed protein product [Heterobilharzia americana]|nr:unnamed protein product [Heterobilharzia americana]